MEAMLSWAVGSTNRYKIQLVLTARSIEQVDNSLIPISYEQALKPFTQVQVEDGKQMVNPGENVVLSLVGMQQSTGLQLDAGTGTYWFSYVNGGGKKHTIWLGNASSLARKLQIVSQYNLRGVAIDNLLGEANDPQMWEVIRKFHEQIVPPVQSQFDIVWKIQDGNGATVAEQKKPLSDPKFEWTAPQNPGKYMIEAAVSADGQVSNPADVNKVALVVAVPTPTPLPTPTPEPTATPKPKAVAKAPAPAAEDQTGREGSRSRAGCSGRAPPPETAPSSATASRLTCTTPTWAQSSAPSKVLASTGSNSRWCGLTWNPARATSSGASWTKSPTVWPARALSPMFSVTKAPKWARPGNTDFSVEGPPANAQDFASFMGAMAGHYKGNVKAYEIWNEQNLHYEWGNEHIDPARYMQLLKASYAAIKAADPGRRRDQRGAHADRRAAARAPWTTSPIWKACTRTD